MSRLHRCSCALLHVVILLLGGVFTIAQADEEGYRTLFNGKDLTGWDGNPELWSVQEGVLTGTADGTLKMNQFLSWTGGNLDDFELKLDFRMEGNSNSGVQYRSQRMPSVGPWVVGGYQADIHPAAKYTGMLYEERGRGIVAERGQKVIIQNDGKKEVNALPGVFDTIDLTQWHELTVRCEGIHLIHQLDGITAVDVTDHQEPGQSLSGILALQLHVGPPMKVQFRNIRLKTLKPAAGAQSSLPTPNLKQVVSRIHAQPGYQVELISTPDGQQLSSWRELCADPQGHLFATNDRGELFRVTPTGIDGASATQIEKVNVPLNRCRQLLWAFDSLYAVTASTEEGGVEIARLRDTNGDHKLDAVEKLRSFPGTAKADGCELVVSPGGKAIDVICPRGAALPEVNVSHVPAVWDEDSLLPRLHGNGAFQGIPAPGGFVARMSPDGQHLELLAVGLSSPGGVVSHAQAGLLLCDVDSPADAGSPWFRSTRLCQVRSGADFGWRSGSAKHPEYYPDTATSIRPLPVQLPTGACFGEGAGFPQRHQQSLFVCDGQQGIIYALPLQPQGSTCSAQVEEFLTTPGLPLGDVLINSVDGAMYLAVRGDQPGAGLYRISSNESQPQVELTGFQASSDSEERTALQQLEELHGPDHVDAVEKAWPFLSHEDPAIRAAARTAIEFRPVEEFASQAMNEQNVQAKLEALLALCRRQLREGKGTGEAIDSPAPDWEGSLGSSLGARGVIQVGILTSLSGLNWSEFTFEQRMLGLRIVQLAMIRLGQPDSFVRDALLDSLGDTLPAKRTETNSQLLEILVYLQSSQAADQGMELLRSASSPEEQALYAGHLASLRAGWTAELRAAFFQWCRDVEQQQLTGDTRQCVVELQKRAWSALTAEEQHTVLQLLKSTR